MQAIKQWIGLWLCLPVYGFAQTGQITGTVTGGGRSLQWVQVKAIHAAKGTLTDSMGHFTLAGLALGEHEIAVRMLGFEAQSQKVVLDAAQPTAEIAFDLQESDVSLDEVVITGTMKEVSKLDSPVPVEVYNACFFRANPAPSVFESLQQVNGVRPQLNCNICSTGDIHINGLEGPYTMVLIDGMPIVSGLSTVYGLTGIPQSLIERVEVVKGPASTLYGSEAVGGLINIITKKTEHAPLVSTDVFGTSWGELNADVGVKYAAGSKAQGLVGINYFNYQLPKDNNGDGFTDLTLQHRVSVFNKWSFSRKQGRIFSLAGRYVAEDRWGGEMDWTPAFRGGDSIYGESIGTRRWELFGVYQLPVKELIKLQFSANGHLQDAAYGNVPYVAQQYVVFGQMTWNKSLGHHHDLLLGTALRYTFYDDNTPATASSDGLRNAPSATYLPGLFFQDEIALNARNTLLIGGRYDYNSVHGHIFTPRLNYRLSSADKQRVLRLSAGNGYRVANVFTEDHAALTGARQVVFTEALRPETSWNANANFVARIFTRKNGFIGFDASTWYTYFTNRIVPDYETNPNQIIYSNLDGYSVSKGISLNVDIVWKDLRIIAGGTLMDVTLTEQGQRVRQLFTERITGTWSIGYQFPRLALSLDYTGNVYGPMRLPLLSALDNRPAYSPWFSVQNLQVTRRFAGGWEVYGGVKNLLNFTPVANAIARPFDPFDRQVQFGADGQVVPTAGNPYALTFDPTYVYTSNQGMRGFLGVRYLLRQK